MVPLALTTMFHTWLHSNQRGDLGQRWSVGSRRNRQNTYFTILISTRLLSLFEICNTCNLVLSDPLSHVIIRVSHVWLSTVGGGVCSEGGGGYSGYIGVCRSVGGPVSIRICYGTVVVHPENPRISLVPVHLRKLQRGFQMAPRHTWKPKQFVSYSELYFCQLYRVKPYLDVHLLGLY